MNPDLVFEIIDLGVALAKGIAGKEAPDLTVEETLLEIARKTAQAY
jgi:hypothetical protein